MAPSQLSPYSWYRKEPSFYTKIEEHGQSDHGSEYESQPKPQWILRKYSVFRAFAIVTAALSSISLLAITILYLAKRQPASFVPDSKDFATLQSANSNTVSSSAGNRYIRQRILGAHSRGACALLGSPSSWGQRPPRRSKPVSLWSASRNAQQRQEQRLRYYLDA